LETIQNKVREFNDLAPCGVFCGACPSYEKSCNGCASEDKNQSRRSKWTCKIRTCCYYRKMLDFCFECSEFTCNIFNNKLLDKHWQDPRYTYRFEIPTLFKKIKEMNAANYHEFQLQRWSCKCGGTIKFYDYKCSKCNAKRLIILDD
jgi:hypothetical protein